MKISQCLMDKVTVDLTRMTSLSIDDGIREHLRPMIAKPAELVFKLGSRFVSSVHTIISFLEHCLCLFV